MTLKDNEKTHIYSVVITMLVLRVALALLGDRGTEL